MLLVKQPGKHKQAGYKNMGSFFCLFVCLLACLLVCMLACFVCLFVCFVDFF